MRSGIESWLVAPRRPAETPPFTGILAGARLKLVGGTAPVRLKLPAAPLARGDASPAAARARSAGPQVAPGSRQGSATASGSGIPTASTPRSQSGSRDGGTKVEAKTMKAVAVIPGKAQSVHLTEMARPTLDEVPNGRGVLVRVLRVGVDGTDREIDRAEYGAAPPGYSFLVLGHESFGRVEAVGPAVTELAPGDYVVATVRRPGTSIYDTIGTYDMTTDDTYTERGINLRHGYLTEYYVDDVEYIVKVPAGLKDVAVLLEPTTVVEKGIAQAYEIQRRLRVWRPRRGAVLGAGTIGLLATLVMRLRGMDVTTFGLTKKPYLNAELVEALGARYLSTADVPLRDGARQHGPFDLIFEATGYSPIVFDAMRALGKNGVLVLSSVTGGNHMTQVPADKINLEFVLGNKVMVGTVNANREYFEMGVRDLSQAELQYPGWLERLLTHPVKGLENYAKLFEYLANGAGVIKVYCEVAEG